MNIIIFGAGIFGTRYYNYIKKYMNDITVLAFTDNNPQRMGTVIDGVKIIHPDEIKSHAFDKIVIATNSRYAGEILAQLEGMNIPKEKIEHDTYSDVYGYDENTDERVKWLRDCAGHIHKYCISGSVAECGVHMGFFARFINKYFPDRTMYLFDTFEGFPAQDVDMELSLGNDSFNNSEFAADKGIFSCVDVERVMQHMPHREKCVVKKGFFPETAAGVEDSFCFVNLDMDLYQPMLAALEFFWDKMAPGSIMLLHDYYHPELPGVAMAVEDFEKTIRKRICKTPIGDSLSIALIKDSDWE